MIIGLIFFGLTFKFLSENNSTGTSIFLTLGLGLISMGIALYSVGIGHSSDKKMQSIDTGDFYEIANRFWDRAPPLYKEQTFGYRDTCSWQLGNLFRHAERLKKWAEPDVQEKLIKEFKTFLTRLRPTPCHKYWVEIKNYIETC